jgi:hypothetical protein
VSSSTTPLKPPPTAEILGIPLAISDYDEVIAWIDETIAADGRGYATAAAVNLVMSAHEDPAVHAAVLGATLAVPDGQPLVWALHALGHARATRVYGPDLMALYCAHAAAAGATGASIYLYGGRDQSALEQLERGLRERFPGLRIAGGHSPPFRPLTPAEEDTVIAEMAPRLSGLVSDSPSRSSGCTGCAHACPRHCSSVSAPPSTSMPASSPRRRPGCSATAWSGPTGSTASPVAYGGATPATTPASSPASRVSTCASAADPAKPSLTS